MRSQHKKILAVPTNIITGFLGVGKTTAIVHLLTQKPSNERWAVLVNEFGEIGVDGSLIKGNHAEEQQIYIREVPGGCMCCAAGLPMQIALNQLLSRAKPDRLLIEPTGLGHPFEVLDVLSTEHYQKVLSIEKIVTLVDARQISDSKYTGHATFNQQITIADTIVGNKQDLYSPADKIKLTEFVQCNSKEARDIQFTEHGMLDLTWLQGPSSAKTRIKHHHSSHQDTNSNTTSQEETPLPECGYLKAMNQGEGFQSVGWRFDPSITFNHTKLFTFFNRLNAERMKAVLITDIGIFAYNLTSDALTEMELDECVESRIEIIAETIDERLEDQLMDCMTMETNQHQN